MNEMDGDTPNTKTKLSEIQKNIKSNELFKYIVMNNSLEGVDEDLLIMSWEFLHKKPEFIRYFDQNRQIFELFMKKNVNLNNLLMPKIDYFSHLAFPLKVYFMNHNLVIFSTCATWGGIVNLLEYFYNKKDRKYIFITMDWTSAVDMKPENWKNKFGKYKDIMYLLANEYETFINRKEAGFKSFLINHNTWINEKIFTIKNNKNKQYDAILTARAKKWKRIYLAKKVPNLALVINRWNISHQRGENDNSYISMNTKYLNSRRLTKEEITDLYNSSRVGLCLSTYEGACYTASEYLLCGIPVVSTKPEQNNSLGGREFWFTDYNSILCEPNENSVMEAVINMIKMNPDPKIIREAHLKQMNRQRNLFVKNVLQDIFDNNGIQMNAYDYFKNNLFDDAGKCKLLSEKNLCRYSDLDKF